MIQDLNKKRTVQLYVKDSKWKKLKEQRDVTKKYFNEANVSEVVEKALESISTPLSLYANGLITKERYDEFLDDVKNKKIKIKPSDFKKIEL